MFMFMIHVCTFKPHIHIFVNLALTLIPFLNNKQYTSPNFGSYDLKKFICPKCDEPAPPSLQERLITAIDNLVNSTTSHFIRAGNLIHQIRVDVKTVWQSLHRQLEALLLHHQLREKSALEFLLEEALKSV